jgi:hypothetical protein
MEERIMRLKEVFPAADFSYLREAAALVTNQAAIDYLKQIYGPPLVTKSAWTRPPPTSAVAPPPKARPVLEERPRLQFDVEMYKVKECRNKSGCACDGFHHEYERRRSLAKHKYSEIPCPNVFKNSSWTNPANCKKRDNCGHSHTVNEASYHARTYKTKPCSHFDNGTCRYGSKCCYIHGTPDAIADEWREYLRSKQTPQTRPAEEQAMTVADVIAVKSVKPPSSNLSAVAWSYAPDKPVLSPMEEMNIKLQAKVEDLLAKLLCSICYHNQKSCALVPCGHLFCEDCITSTFTAVCPVCRREFTAKLGVFF